MKTLAAIGGLLIALGGAALAGFSARGAHQTRVDLARSVESGPRDEALPEGAIVARDAGELLQLLDDPKGPGVIGLLPQVYEADLKIRRSVVLVGAVGTIIQGTGADTVVTIQADDVVLRNVIVRRSGSRHTLEDGGIRATGHRVKLEHLSVSDCLFGVSFRECVDCVLDGAHIVGRERDPELRGDAVKLWESDRSVVRGSLVENSRDIVVWYSKHVTLEDNVVTNSRYGSHFMYAHDSLVRRSRFVNDTVGIFVMYSSRVTVEDNVLAGASGPAGIGIGFKEADDVSLARNMIVGNTLGAYLDQSPRTPGKTLVLDGNMLALNQVGLRLHGPQSGATFRNNDFHENASVVEIESGDATGSVFLGNRFSDYEGYDLDRDGLGDVAYEQRVLSSELMVVHPSLRLMQGTAAMGTVDAIAHAFPVFAARKILSDPRPRISPLEMSFQK